MLCFLLGLSQSGKYESLIAKAKHDAYEKPRLLRASAKLQDLQPGTYSSNGFEYTIRSPITGDLSSDVLGFAMEASTMAVVKKSPKITKLNTVFSDSAQQQVYRLKGVLESENEVDVYEVENIEPLDVISNIKYNASKDSFFKRDFNSSLKWKETPDPFFDGRPEYINPENDYMKFGAGAYINTEVSLDFDLSLKNISMTAHIQTKGVFGASINISLANDAFKMPNTFSKNITIPNGLSFSILGVNIALKTEFFSILKFDTNFYNVPESIDIYRSYIITMDRTISIINGKFISQPTKFNLEQVGSKSDVVELAKSFDGSHLIFSPSASLGIDISLNAGLKQYISTSITLVPRIFFEMSFNKEQCRAPYLYGYINPRVDLLYNFSGFKPLGFNVMEPVGKIWNLYEFHHDDVCLFGSRDNSENLKSEL